MGESQYCQGSTPVLSKEYCSTFRGVLQYFHGSTGTRENCSVLSTECLA